MARKIIRNSDVVDKKIIFVADMFRENFLGGAESNDAVLIDHFRTLKYKIELKTCSELKDFHFNKNNIFIISNFISLSERHKTSLQKEKYIIYEHDHKYIKTRDPSKYKDFLAPSKDIINYSFYKNAAAVVVLSNICKEVIEKNLNIDNVYNIGCSLWSDNKLDFIRSLTTQIKNNKFVVLDSSNPIKNTIEAVKFCKDNKIDFDLIPPSSEKELLTKLSFYNGLVFFPKVLETFSRISAEAKMVNCKLITRPKMLGFASEDIYKLSGFELIEEIKIRRDRAIDLFIKLIEKL